MNFEAIIPQNLSTTASPTFAGLTVGTLSLASGSIADSGGAIDFGNEYLTMSGRVGIGSGAVPGANWPLTVKEDFLLGNKFNFLIHTIAATEDISSSTMGDLAANLIFSSNQNVSNGLMFNFSTNFLTGAVSGNINEFVGIRHTEAIHASYTGTIAAYSGFKVVGIDDAHITNAYGLYIGNVQNATSGNYAIYTNNGVNRFGGNVRIEGTKIQNTYGKVYCGTKTLTDGSVTGFVDIDIASGTMIGGTIHYLITATDGTDYQAHEGSITFAAVNKGGTITNDVDEVYLAASETEALSDGTLSDAWTITNGANKITLNCEANSSLTSPTIQLIYYLTLHSIQLFTPL